MTLQLHVPNTGTSWTRLWGTNALRNLEINANACRPATNASSSGIIYTADGTYPTANYDAVFTIGATTTLGTFYALIRLQDQENMYGVYLLEGVNVCQLYKKVSGTWTALGSAFDEPVAGSVCKLEMIGSALKFYDDGVVVASATDSDISGAGKFGFAAGGGAELVLSTDVIRTAWRVDTLTVTDLGASVAKPSYAYHMLSAQ